MSDETYEVVIVGAGQAGAQCAVALRHGGFTGRIALVGDEPEFPYERPPLSKEYFSGARRFEDFLIRPADYWAKAGIDLRRGERVVHVYPVERTVRTEDGKTLGYGRLVWAAGGAPRRLRCHGGDLAGVHVLRGRADVDAILSELIQPLRVAIVGGGFIGLEAAAVLNGLGHRVTVFEAQPRLLARVAGEAVSRFYRAEHERKGVEVRTSATISAIVGEVGRAVAVKLGDGNEVATDLVLVGIGIEPAVGPLKEAGALGDDGVEVDGLCRTNLPDVFAIGDCAAHRNRYAGGARVRLESFQNANDMAAVVAGAILDAPQGYAAAPWFWSDQYDLKLQSLGISTGHDEEVVRGDPATRSFAVVYLREGRVVALDCVNAPRDYVQGRSLVIGNALVDRSRLADISAPLRTAVAA